jgi:hypothetical protein
MGWSFRVTCPDCVHGWEGIQTSYRIGYWSELSDPAIDDGFRSWFCPRCSRASSHIVRCFVTDMDSPDQSLSGRAE